MIRRAMLSAPLLLLANSAWAQCEGTWDNARIAGHLDEADTALAQADLVGAKKGLKEAMRGWPCLEELADPKLIGRYGRANGLLAFYEQDEPSAVKWGLMARVVDPDGTWPGELPEGHPYLGLLAESEDPAKVRAEGWLNPPDDKGSLFLNGAFLAEPEAWAEVPGLIQAFDKVGYPTEAFWQDGAAFRESLITAEGGPLEVPRYYNEKTGELKVADSPAKVKHEKIQVEKTPTDFPVVPVATAGGLAVLSGVSYALASGAAGGLNTAETEADLTRARSTTNAFVLVSAITGAGAVGVGLGTVLVHGNGVSWHVRF